MSSSVRCEKPSRKDGIMTLSLLLRCLSCLSGDYGSFVTLTGELNIWFAPLSPSVSSAVYCLFAGLD